MRSLVVLISIGLAGCISDAAPTPPKPESVVEYSFREITPAERKLLAKTFADALKDPDSARWEWPPIRSDVKDGAIVYCGRVNAKNSYGGYTGHRTFISTVSVHGGVVTDGRMNNIATAPLDTLGCRDIGLPLPTVD
jgi:hypothetical protein